MILTTDFLLMLTVATTFGAWGWLLSSKLTNAGQVFEVLPRLFPYERPISNPIWACATCVAGFQSAIVCAFLYYTDLISLLLVFPTVVLSMAVATKLDK